MTAEKKKELAARLFEYQCEVLKRNSHPSDAAKFRLAHITITQIAEITKCLIDDIVNETGEKEMKVENSIIEIAMNMNRPEAGKEPKA